jgi:hypothetical protein
MLIDGVPLPPTVNIGTPGSLTSMLLDQDANIDILYASGSDSLNNTLYSFRESTNQGLSFSAPSLLPVKENFNFLPSRSLSNSKWPLNAKGFSISSLCVLPTSASPRLAGDCPASS